MDDLRQAPARTGRPRAAGAPGDTRQAGTRPRTHPAPAAPGRAGGTPLRRDAVHAYRELVLAQIRSQGQYRRSFALDVTLTSFVCLLELLTTFALFRVTPELGGFPLREVLLMGALSGLGFQLADVAVGNIESLAGHVRTGRLDTVLLRPLSPLGQLLATDFPIRKIGRVVQSAVVYAVVLACAGLHWTPARAVLVVVAPSASAALFAAVFVAGATVAFWWIDSGEFANAFTYGGRTFAQYPATVYPPWLRAPFAYGLGFAFTGYQPALALLGRPDPLGTPAWVAWSTPAVAVAAWIAALALWRTGIRRYRSTGS